MKKILWAICLMVTFAIVFALPTFALEGEAVEVEEEMTFTESIVTYVQDNYKDISVIITLACTVFYEVRKHGKLNGSIGTLNNNAITVATQSADAIKTAMEKTEAIASTVVSYGEKMETMLREIAKLAEEKQSLEDMLSQVGSYLSNAKLANIEFANEMAELLCLSNIPNAKKEELYARHRAALATINVEGTDITEVKLNDGIEA